MSRHVRSDQGAPESWWWRMPWISWLYPYRFRLIVFSCFVLCLILGYLAGVASESQNTQDSLIVETVREDCPAFPNIWEADKQLTTSAQQSASVLGEEVQNCNFVGSVNSDKYHSPTCHWAKRIKPQNIRCFQSVEEAKRAGYVEGCIE